MARFTWDRGRLYDRLACLVRSPSTSLPLTANHAFSRCGRALRCVSSSGAQVLFEMCTEEPTATVTRADSRDTRK